MNSGWRMSHSKKSWVTILLRSKRPTTPKKLEGISLMNEASTPLSYANTRFCDAGDRLSLRLAGPIAEKVTAIISPYVTWTKGLDNLWVGIASAAGIVRPVTLII